MPGPAKTPTALALVKGNPGKQKLNRAEPTPTVGVPKAPRYLSARGKKGWRELSRLLQDMAVLSMADGAALESLCECYAEVVELRQTLVDEGRFYRTTTPNGGTMVRAHPAVGALADADRRLKNWLCEFGLTPAARTKIHIGHGASKAAGGSEAKAKPAEPVNRAAQYFT